MDEENNQFELVIDFYKGGNPNRVFKSMTELIDSFQELDITLSEILGVKVENSLILEDIEKGSLKTIIRNSIKDLPDEDLRDAKFKRILGFYLVKAKYAVLNWCQEIPKLTNTEQVDVLENELIKIAEDSEINQIPAYQPPNRIKLLTNIDSLQKATKHLEEDDSVYFNCKDGSSLISDGVEISNTIIEDVLTKEIIEDRSVAILKVKKPDYLGLSKWVFRFQGHLIDVSITAQSWLNEFQQKEKSVRPGDSIRGSLVQYISYGYDGEVLRIRYELESIDEVIEAQTFMQLKFKEF